MKYIDIFENEEGVRAFFTTKEGAVKGTPGGTIFRNGELFEEIGVSEMYKVWPRQVHGTNVEAIKKEDLDWFRENYPDGLILPETDGVITDAPGVLLTSVHADCLPVYLYDGRKGVIGIVHAGWRGAVAGIVPQAIRKMTYVFGAGLDDIKTYIGPGISSCCFEVGEEVPAQFLLEWGSSYAEPIEKQGENGKSEENGEDVQKYLLDLKEAVRQQIIGMKVPEGNISVSSHCTCCEPEMFCSFRRDGEQYLRMGAGIYMP